MTTLTALVKAIRLEASDIISLELMPTNDVDQFPTFEPGSHIDLHLPNGMIRSYSLLNDPLQANRYIVGVLNDKNSRGGSKWIHEHIRVGMILAISAPRNNFPLRPTTAKSVLLAGGIGITPILCMLRELSRQGQAVDLIYCARSKEQVAFLTEIQSLLSEKIRLITHFDSEVGGVPPDLTKLLGDNPKDTNFYCCGPSPMISAFEQTCEKLGYANFYIERFAAEKTAPVPVGEGYRVELKKANRVVHVMKGQSLLDALLDAGLTPDHSCRDGICGACETKVLCGEVDHHDSILTKDERAANKSMMICVSHAKGSSITLDL